jgi:hypothetical protein
VERAVILSETDTFVVDETWLKPESADRSPREGLSRLADRELEMIRAALADSHGRISGPSGAAVKLGIPRQTLESKIRRLRINKNGQKRPPPNSATPGLLLIAELALRARNRPALARGRRIKRRIISSAQLGSRAYERTRTNQEAYYQPTGAKTQ